MKQLIRVALSGALLMIAACSSLPNLNPWSSAKELPKPVELAPIAQSDHFLKTLWHVSVGKSEPYVLTPAVVGMSVYVAEADGDIRRFDNGKEVWRVSAGEEISGGVGCDGKVLAVGTSKGQVLAFDAGNGKSTWKAFVGTEVLSAPAVNAELVIVRGSDSRLLALEVASGKRRWAYQRGTPSLTLRSNVGVTLLPNAVAAGLPGGKLVLIALSNGAPMWEGTVAQPKGATELERVADITSSPVVVGDNICAAAFQGRVACFAISNGSQLWSRDVSSIGGLDASDKTIYVSAEPGTILAFDASNGFNLWKQDKLINRNLSRPLVVGNNVFVADNLGTIHGLDAMTGAFVAHLAVDGKAISAEPQHFGNGMVVQTVSGDIYALSSH